MRQLEDSAATGKPRLVGLDILRFVAVVLVLGRHMPAPPTSMSSGWRSALLTWQRGGWVGVDLFFVLSGFLISGLLFAEYRSHGRLSIARFYTRRGWKIYPPFLTLIAATVLVGVILDLPPRTRFLWHELLFVQNYGGGLWNHTWSLAVEEHFYLFLPLILNLFVRLNRDAPDPFRNVPAVTAAVAVSLLMLRLWNARHQAAFAYNSHLFATHIRFDSLFFGVAISHAYHFHRDAFIRVLTPRRRWLLPCGALFLAPAFAFQLETTPFIYTFGLTLFYLGSGMLLTGMLLCDIRRNRPILLIATLGAYSYSIYLWHLPMMQWGIPFVEVILRVAFPFEIDAVLYVLSSLAVGVLMAKLVEVPALRLRDKWFPSLSGRRSPETLHTGELLPTARDAANADL